MAGDLEALQARRLLREDVPPTEHGLPFSEWEILIRPSDWKDRSSGKNGAERYRLHNLPGGCSRPGIYEFGVARNLPNGRNKLDEASIIPVYVGGAGNVRVRLQQYGRDGAHLDRGSSASSGRATPGLFTEIFKRGYSIVVRWAPVGSREEAKRKEAELLNKYDYAWNKRGNGPRRCDSLLKRLDGVDENEICDNIRDWLLQSDGSTDGSGSEDSEHDSSSDDNNDDGDNNTSLEEEEEEDDDDDEDDDGDDDDDSDDDHSSSDNHGDSSLDNDNDDNNLSPDDDDDDDDDDSDDYDYDYYHGGDSSS